MSATEVADYLGVRVAYVYEHGNQLGARRLGKGPKARLRFLLSEVDGRLSACTARRESASLESAPQAALRPGQRRRMGTSVELLPIRGRIPSKKPLKDVIA